MFQAAASMLTVLKVKAEELAQDHGEMVRILVLFVSLRLSLLVISQPQGYLLSSSDYDFYMEFGRLADRGLYPNLNYWTEYPPLLPWLAVVVYRLVEPIPNFDGSPIFWFRMALGGLMLPFDVGNLILLYWLARILHTPARAVQIAWSYAILFTPLHVWLAWFDTVPLFFLLLGMTLGVKGKRESASLVAGLGFMVKVMPVLTLPALLKAEPPLRGKAKLLAASLLSALLVAAPFLLTGPRYLFASFASLVSRSPWETVWAIYEGYFGYGWVAPLSDRQDPSTALHTAYSSHLPWPAITAAFAALYLLLWSRRFDIHRPAHAVAFTGLTLNIFLLYSKGYSPQFLLYLVPFALLVLSSWRAIGYLTVLGAINLLEYPVYGVLFTQQHMVLAGLVVFRALLLVLMCWEYLAALELLPSMVRARKLAAASGMAAFVIWGSVAMPEAGSRWIQTAAAQRPDHLLLDYLRSNTGADTVVVFTEQSVYRDLYPHLYQRTHLVLVDVSGDRASSRSPRASGSTSSGGDTSGQLARLSAEYRAIFTVRHLVDQNGRELERLLSDRDQLQGVRYAQNLVVSQWIPSREGSAGR